MVNRIETVNESVILQKKEQESASFNALDLLSEENPSVKFKKKMRDEDSLSFDPVSLKKDDIAYAKLKDGDVILQKKLAEDVGEKKKQELNPLERVLEFAQDLFSPRPDKLKDFEKADKEDLVKKYQYLKQQKELDNFDDAYGV